MRGPVYLLFYPLVAHKGPISLLQLLVLVPSSGLILPPPRFFFFPGRDKLVAQIAGLQASKDQQLAFCDQTPCEPRTLICRIPNALDEVGMG